MSNLNYTPMAYAEGVDNENVDSYNKLAQVYGDAEILKYLHKYLTNTDLRLFIKDMQSIQPDVKVLADTRRVAIDVTLGGKRYRAEVQIKEKLYSITIYKMNSDGGYLYEVKSEDGINFDHILEIVKPLIKQYL